MVQWGSHLEQKFVQTLHFSKTEHISQAALHCCMYFEADPLNNLTVCLFAS